MVFDFPVAGKPIWGDKPSKATVDRKKEYEAPVAELNPKKSKEDVPDSQRTENLTPHKKAQREIVNEFGYHCKEAKMDEVIKSAYGGGLEVPGACAMCHKSLPYARGKEPNARPTICRSCLHDKEKQEAKPETDANEFYFTCVTCRRVVAKNRAPYNQKKQLCPNCTSMNTLDKHRSKEMSSKIDVDNEFRRTYKSPDAYFRQHKNPTTRSRSVDVSKIPVDPATLKPRVKTPDAIALQHRPSCLDIDYKHTMTRVPRTPTKMPGDPKPATKMARRLTPASLYNTEYIPMLEPLKKDKFEFESRQNPLAKPQLKRATMYQALALGKTNVEYCPPTPKAPLPTWQRVNPFPYHRPYVSHHAQEYQHIPDVNGLRERHHLVYGDISHYAEHSIRVGINLFSKSR